MTRSFLITVAGCEDRRDSALAHLRDRGVIGVTWFKVFQGINGETAGLSCTNSHTLPDNSRYTPTPKHISLCLNHWFLWQRISGDSSFWDMGDHSLIMEDDVRFTEDWLSKAIRAKEDVPEDWDLLFLGSCHARNHPVHHVKGDVWKVEKPNCTHAYYVRHKALPILIDRCQRIYTNIDWSIIEQAIPHLNAYAILPRIAHQHGMENLPE